jgi:hypothetical protein
MGVAPLSGAGFAGKVSVQCGKNESIMASTIKKVSAKTV